jgi:hypothetical protein
MSDHGQDNSGFKFKIRIGGSTFMVADNSWYPGVVPGGV